MNKTKSQAGLNDCFNQCSLLPGHKSAEKKKYNVLKGTKMLVLVQMYYFT